jgi:hypothetical protein
MEEARGALRVNERYIIVEPPGIASLRVGEDLMSSRVIKKHMSPKGASHRGGHRRMRMNPWMDTGARGVVSNHI